MNQFKRLVCLLCSLLLLWSCAAAEADGEEPVLPELTISGDYGYAVQEDGTAAIYSYTGEETELVLPDALDDIPVTVIGFGFLSDCETVTAVQVPSGVNTVDEKAFTGCTALTKLTLPNTLRAIRSGAFTGCTALKMVRIPNSLVSLGTGAFADCPVLTLHVTSGTVAEMFAESSGIPYVSYD